MGAEGQIERLLKDLTSGDKVKLMFEVALEIAPRVWARLRILNVTNVTIAKVFCMTKIIQWSHNAYMVPI